MIRFLSLPTILLFALRVGFLQASPLPEFELFINPYPDASTSPPHIIATLSNNPVSHALDFNHEPELQNTNTAPTEEEFPLRDLKL
jgi:hypothetical protein